MKYILVANSCALQKNRCYSMGLSNEWKHRNVALGMYFSQFCLFGQRVQSPLWLFFLQPPTGRGGRAINTTLWLDRSRECPGWPGKMVLLWWHCRRGQRASLSWWEARRGSSHLKTCGKLPVHICINTLGNEAQSESHRHTGGNRSSEGVLCVGHTGFNTEKSFQYICIKSVQDEDTDFYSRKHFIRIFQPSYKLTSWDNFQSSDPSIHYSVHHLYCVGSWRAWRIRWSARLSLW